MIALIRRFFSSRSLSIKQASALLAITALVSNILGLARNLIFYRVVPFEQLDVYYASFRVADFLFNFLIFGAMTSAFIPIISGMIHQDKEKEAWETTNQLISWFTVFFLLLIVILALAMDPLVRKIVPDFDPVRLATTIELSRILLLQTLIFAWSYILGSLLNSYRRFTTYALAPLVYNLAIITGGLLYPYYGIHGLTWSVVIGAALHFLIQYSELLKTGFRFKFTFKYTPYLKEIVTLMIPRSLSQGLSQIVLTVYTSLGSGLQKGSITIFSAMNDLQTTPVVIIGNSLATACFPSLAAHISKGEWKELSQLLTKTIRTALFLLIPTLAICLILRAQIVRLYIGIGGASWEETNIAIATFVWFMLGVIPAALVAIFARTLYAFKDTKTPLIIGSIASLLGIIIAYYGIIKLRADVSTFAFAESIISLTQCYLYLYILHKRQHLEFSLATLGKYATTYTVGAVLMAGSIWSVLQAVDMLYLKLHRHYPGLPLSLLDTDRILGLLIQTSAALTVGILVYFVYSTYRSKEELRWTLKRSFTPSP